MKIHIMGASCAGSTTLGNALSARTGIPYFDTDQFFWEPSEIPYTVKTNPVIRNQKLTEATGKAGKFIVGGSLISWGDAWLSAFDLVVFLYVPAEIRMQRLVDRELERYGDAIYSDPVRSELFKSFYDWAMQYDNPDFTGRNLQIHEDWLKKLSCKVLEIRGDTSVEERLERILAVVSSEA